MQARWKELLQRFSQLSARERGLVLVAVFAVAYQLADLVVFDRLYQQIEQLNRDIARDNRAIGDLNTELRLLASRAQHDPNAALRSEIEAARVRVKQRQAQLADATADMISPRDMARFLEQLLVQEGGLTMVGLQTLDAQPLSPRGSPAADTPQPVQSPVLYRHAFEIAFSGGYLATLRYLQALEALPWRFIWDGVDYEVIDYPQSIVRMRLHTLSLSEDWIGV